MYNEKKKELYKKAQIGVLSKIFCQFLLISKKLLNQQSI